MRTLTTLIAALLLAETGFAAEATCRNRDNSNTWAASASPVPVTKAHPLLRLLVLTNIGEQ